MNNSAQPEPSAIPACTADLQTGRRSALALTEAALERIADPAGEGVRVFTSVYAAQARASAQASDLLRAAGLPRPVLDGVTVSIKDLFDVAGETTLAGSRVLEGAPVAAHDAEVVRRLRAAGAIVVGRTNMTEFAYSGLGINPHYGTPLNPWDRANARIPGGSSSGAGVSVADGMALAGIGSDTGGSIRIPAALCGLTGFKPTARRVPMQGVLPLSRHLDSIGAITADVTSCALVDAVLAAEPAEVPAAREIAGLRLAVPTTVVLDELDAAVASAFQRSLSLLSAAGAQVREIAVPAFARSAAINAKGGFTAVEAWAWHHELIARAEAQYDPRVVSRIRRGAAMSGADLLDLFAARQAWMAEVTEAIAAYDALLMPTVPLIAPKLAELQSSDDAYFRANGLMLRNPTLINFLDGCALSLPCHAAGDAPVGLMLAAAAQADRRLLGIGLAVECCLRQGGTAR